MVYQDEDGNYRNAAGWKVSAPDDEPSDAEQERSRETARKNNEGSAPGTSDSGGGGSSGSGDSGIRTISGPQDAERSYEADISEADRDRLQELKDEESGSSSGGNSSSGSDPDIFDPTAEDSPGGSTVGSDEIERYLREAREAGATLDNLEENGAIAAQIEQATGTDPRTVAARRGGREKVNVSLDAETGQFTSEFTEKEINRRNQQRRDDLARRALEVDGVDSRDDFRIEEQDGQFVVEPTKEFIASQTPTRRTTGFVIPDSRDQERDAPAPADRDFVIPRVPGGPTPGGPEQGPSRVDSFVSDVERTLGFDVPGSGPVASPQGSDDSEEQFGDFDWSFGFRDEDTDEVEKYVDSFAAETQRATEGPAEGLFSKETIREGSFGIFSGESVTAEVAGAVAGDAAKDQVDNFVRELGVGVSSGTATALAGVPSTALEAAEFAAFAATNPGETGRELPDAAAEAAVSGAEGFLANPGRGTGGLLGGAAAGVGFGRFLGTTRVGQGTSGRIIDAADIDPASSAARGARRAAAGVRDLAGDRRGQADLIGRSRSRSSGSDTTTITAEDLDVGGRLSDPSRGGRFGDDGPSRSDGSLAADNDIRTLDRETSTSLGFRSPETSTGRSFTSTADTDLRRLDQLDRELARDVDGGRTARDVFTPEGLRVNEVRVSDGAFGLGGASAASVTADARGRQAAAQASSFDADGALLGPDSDTDIFAGGVTDTDTGSDVLGRTDTDIATDIVVTPDTRTGTDTALFTPERFLTPDPEFTPDPDPDPEFTPDPDPDPEFTPDPVPRRKREDDPFALTDDGFGFDADENVFRSGIESADDLLDDFGL